MLVRREQIMKMKQITPATSVSKGFRFREYDILSTHEDQEECEASIKTGDL